MEHSIKAGLMITSASDYNMEICRGANEACKELGIELVIFFGGSVDPNVKFVQSSDYQKANVYAFANYLDLDFFEAVNGVEKEIFVNVKTVCNTCSGTGAKPGTKKVTCKKCNGRGSIRVQRQSFFGTVVSEELCNECNGTGEIVEEKCEKCKGKKYVLVRKKFTVKAPKGVNTNNIMTLKGQGNCGENGGPNGDVYVIFKVKSHELFVRNGNNVFYELPISFTEATLGAEVEIPTLEGKEKYTIPEGTDTGTEFILKDRGISDVNGYGKGNLTFRVKIITPKNLTDRQKELLREFSNEREEHLTEHKKNFFEKVKELFE